MNRHEDSEYADLGAWRASRAEHQPPHDRFFEDGEEPPERHDLPDLTDYIEVNPDPVRSWRWYRIGWRAIRAGGTGAYGYAFGYYVVCSITYCLTGPLLQLLLGPAFHGDITVHWLARFTGNGGRFKTPVRSNGKTLRVAFGNLAVQLSGMLAIIGLLLLMGFTIEGIRDARFQPVPLSERFPVVSLYVLIFCGGSAAIILLQAFIAVRICGFVTCLIIDYELDPVEAVRANWRITQRRTWQLMRVKIALWVVKYTIGWVSAGLGLILLEPYCVAVWTAAYLDIAGSEPINGFSSSREGSGSDTSASGIPISDALVSLPLPSRLNENI